MELGSSSVVDLDQEVSFRYLCRMSCSLELLQIVNLNEFAFESNQDPLT